MDRRVHTFLIAVAAVLFFTASTTAQTSKQTTDVRNASWGTTRLEVMASEEKAPEFFGLSLILYKPEIEGRNFKLIYGFIENQLTGAEYRFIAHNAREYLWLKKRIAIKYGSPSFSHDGGAENFEYKWKRTGTEITLRPGRQRECVVEYKGLKYTYLEALKEKKIIKMKELNAKKTF